MTVDNLPAAEIVTADGRVRVVDADQEPALLWAIRGGGANFGVVTRFRYRLAPVSDVYGSVLNPRQPRRRSVSWSRRASTRTTPSRSSRR
jgi:FAD/FMN-containing dehydrogenase